MNILVEYELHIIKMKKNSSEILKVLNQIDLYGEKIIDSVDNFNDLLEQTKKEVNKHQNDKKSYENIKDEILLIIEKIDKSFNKNNDKKKTIQKKNQKLKVRRRPIIVKRPKITKKSRTTRNRLKGK